MIVLCYRDCCGVLGRRLLTVREAERPPLPVKVRRRPVTIISLRRHNLTRPTLPPPLPLLPRRLPPARTLCRRPVVRLLVESSTLSSLVSVSPPCPPNHNHNAPAATTATSVDRTRTASLIHRSGLLAWMQPAGYVLVLTHVYVTYIPLWFSQACSSYFVHRFCLKLQQSNKIIILTISYLFTTFYVSVAYSGDP